MEKYFDKQGKSYSVDLDSPLGRGADGYVCNLVGMPDKVAKICKEDATDESLKEAAIKVAVMADTFANFDAKRRSEFSSQITWPEKALYDSSGKYKGFIMQKIVGHQTLDNAYAESQALSRNFTFAEKILIARNLCVAVHLVHSIGCVVGDFNPRNIMVDLKKGTVFLCDADSFHLRVETVVRNRKVREYLPTKKGRPELLPPELQDFASRQKASLDKIPQPSFNRETDLFALAIHIFQLLMSGTHPFALEINPAKLVDSISNIDVSWVANIRNGRYVFSNSPSLKKVRNEYNPPSYAPDYAIIPPALQVMFDRAFVLDSNARKRLAREPGDEKYFSSETVRPSASEWYFALDYYYKHLVTCDKDKSHRYGDHLTRCPWCKGHK